VILSNYYHLLVKVKGGKNLKRFFRRFHSELAACFNKIDGTLGRQIFYQYWDEYLDDEHFEDDFYRFVNYIHINPLKHREIRVKDGLIRVSGKDVIIPE
jgi:REP element-mobilizing transposase RayT